MRNDKSLKLGVVLSYLTEGIAIVLSLLYTPIKIRMLGQSDYGVYQLVASIINYLSLLSMGFGSSYVRFYTRFKEQEDEEGIAKLNGMFMIIFSVISIVALLLGVLMIFNAREVLGNELSTDEIILAKKLMCFLVVNIALTFPISVFSNYLIAKERFVFIKGITIVLNILNPLLSFPLLMFGYKAVGLVLVSSIITILQLVIFAYYCLKKLDMRFVFGELNWILLKEIWVFSAYIFISMVVDQINWNVDKFIIGRKLGAMRVAVYSLGNMIGSLFMTFSTAMVSVFVPRLNRLIVGSNDMGGVNELFIKIGRIQFLILTYVLLGYTVLGRYFIHIMGGKGYENAYQVSLIMMIALMTPLCQNLGIEILKAKNMHKFRAILYSGMAMCNIVLTWKLVDVYKEIGAIIATAISIVIANGLIINIYYYKCAGIDIKGFWKNIIRFLPAVTIIGALVVFLNRSIKIDSIKDFLVVGVFYTLIYLVVMWNCGMNRYEKDSLITPIKRIFKK